MQIPLDYYRILGLPIQATSDQLQQAHRDRTLQLPRREYSELAINGRKQLIDEAFQVLNDDVSRKEYDQKFLASAYALDQTVDPLKPESADLGRLEVTPEMGEAALRSLALGDPTAIPEAQISKIEIDDAQFVGGLLILLELGEYEQVIQLGRPYLSSGGLSLTDGQLGAPQTVLSDIVLSLALACLELGREQWQQRQYETAAESLDTGSELLLEENRFPAIRAEIQAELYKLRPYRILELLARPLDQTRERRQGLKLLKTMLEDRGGIEGTDDDLSGLATDDFLRFIQQLRDYLTAAEQQELFEQEARRPSPVAIYLTVYALLARGFARHQPALVRRAKQLLLRLGNQQDVHLEQAVCALLLGQTEEASRALEMSQEYEPLAYIREHSRNSPDLLPGLCLYAERWLREEVFPHFRDFRDQQATLKDYFVDSQVQAYLEAMPPATGVEEGSQRSHDIPTVSGSMPLTSAPDAGPRLYADFDPEPDQSFDRTPDGPRRRNPFVSARGAARSGRSQPEQKTPSAVAAGPENSASDPALSIAERVSQLSPDGKLAAPEPTARRTGLNGRGVVPASGTVIASGPAPVARPPAKPSRSASASLRWDRLALVGLVSLVGIGLLSFVTARTLRWIGSQLSGPQIQGEPLAISVSSPPIEIPSAPSATEQIGVADIAERTINNWLEAKRQALGPDYQADRLNQVLVDPALAQWRRRADAAARENWYWEYEHQVTVESVEPDDPTADALSVTATVTEKGRFFEYDVENTAASYNDKLRMQYDLVRQDGNWFVQNITKLGDATE